MHAKQACSSQPSRKPNLLPGPHHCSAVGNDVSMVLRTAFMEMCDRHNGQLSREEINHTIDLVMNSPELFFLYRQGYSGCVGIKNSPQFKDIDEFVIVQFIVRTYCQDAVSRICETKTKARRAPWSASFVEGFTIFLTEDIDPYLSKNLFHVYQKLVTQLAGSLTPITILGSDELIAVFGQAIDLMQEKFRLDPTTIGRFETTLNKALAGSLKFGSSNSEKLKRSKSLGFISGLANPMTDNSFRKSIVTRVRNA